MAWGSEVDIFPRLPDRLWRAGAANGRTEPHGLARDDVG